ncbi:16S rRNA processing protein RimM [Ornithobacterium rhinotracheale]|uniref:Ribosome maturation factor RimM n=1 Tax=Ornithobacterium rhinotracheale TaxID=28251 RepID=A0A410JTM2_ORNRH|nr:ribosome maturation factor RimM [Ornithobacterium rhinotracheale]QAR31557.1 16S rRNA processing protein RimM [Ornithobacterium rhinotracheale]
MQKQDCYLLGTITKAIGYKGELNLFLDTDEPETYQNLESIFVEQHGLLVPFFLKKAELHRGNHLRILIEDCPDPERMIGKQVFLPLSTLPALEGNKFYYHEIIGFDVIADGKKIGTVKEVRDTTAQDLLVVQTNDGKEILIPLIDEWLQEVNRAEKSISFNLPEGFLSIFE